MNKRWAFGLGALSKRWEKLINATHDLSSLFVSLNVVSIFSKVNIYIHILKKYIFLLW